MHCATHLWLAATLSNGSHPSSSGGGGGGRGGGGGGALPPHYIPMGVLGVPRAVQGAGGPP